jgi:NAD(P)-dependent dehydrogenase (short-subunit alcohol dehydrogenase family)
MVDPSRTPSPAKPKLRGSPSPSPPRRGGGRGGSRSPSPSPKPTSSSASTTTGGAALRCGTLTLVLALAFPLLLSQLAGGWVRKFTSPLGGFSTDDIPSMRGKMAIVTGANTGIGYETALALCRKGASVVLAARDMTRGKAAKSAIEEDCKGYMPPGIRPKVLFMQLDLASFKSIESFSLTYHHIRQPLHLLILNAGVMKAPPGMIASSYGYEVTEDGFEGHIGVNHIGHFHLTNLLTDVLKRTAQKKDKKTGAAAGARVVVVSSAAESAAYAPEGIRFDLWRHPPRPVGGAEAAAAEAAHPPADYEDGAAYGQSKLANLLFARELAQRLEGAGVWAVACHPGIIETKLSRHMEAAVARGSVGARALWAALGSLFRLALFTAHDGALTQLQLATAPVATLRNGGFYFPIGELAQPRHPQARNGSLQVRRPLRPLWRPF